MLKIVLEPLVENAINHGILEREDEAGSITVNGSMGGDSIRLTISDNGMGIPKEKLDSLLQKKNGQKRHGYGVWNIHERLRLAYGPEYGLRYESTVGEGTTVTVVLPVVTEP